jgi:hypothetical protein
MMCYQISQNGEPVALVASMALTQQIIQCQPPGFYQVDAVDVGEPISGRRSRARKLSIKHKTRRGRYRANKRRGRLKGDDDELILDQARQQAH